MINLLKNFSTVSTTAIAVFCAFACSDKIAGTAEEPNQFAYGTSSSQDNGASANMPPSSSSTRDIDGHSNYSSSGKSGASGNISSSNSNPIGPVSSSSRDVVVIGGNGNPGHSGGFGNSEGCYTSDGNATLCGDTDTSPTFDDLLKKYNITDATFDKNVLAYNKTFQSCYESTGNCNDKQVIADLRTLGMHKFTKDNLTGIAYLFPNFAKTVGTVYGTDDGITIDENGCPLYVLNVHDTSPAIHVLTQITKDTIYITDFSDKCDYEPRPFETHVGFLFSYCGELSESPKIEIAFKRFDTADCSDVSYEEYIKKNQER